MLVGGGGNVGVFISNGEVILIDNKYEILEDVFMASLRDDITDKPIKYIINTHFHHDHSDGNRAFENKESRLYLIKTPKRMMKMSNFMGGYINLSKILSSQNMITHHCLYLPMKVKMSISQGNEEIELYNWESSHRWR